VSARLSEPAGEQVVNGILINHIDEHCNSIRATVGR
jgi:hypothetical protein